MLHRWTLWEDEHGGAIQLSLALLDRQWEPLVEWTRPCGPFHTAEDVRLELLDELRRWFRTTGYQEELPIP